MDYAVLVGSDLEQTYSPEYVGPGIACSEAEVAFPPGETGENRNFLPAADRRGSDGSSP